MEIITKHFLIYQFAYISFFVSFIFIVFTMFSRSKILKLTSLVIFAVFMAIGFAEYFSALKTKDVKEPIEYQEGIFSIETNKLHQERQIHVINANGQQRKYENRSPRNDEKVIYDSVYTKYTNGFRYTKCNLKSNENYIFLGCSFVVGDGVNDDQTLPYYFSKLMNFEKYVLNCGVSGRSSNSAINILESDIINSFISEKSKTKYFIYSLVNDHMKRNFRISCYGGFPKDNWLYKNGKWKRVNQPFGAVKNMFARSYIFNEMLLNMIDRYNKQYYEIYMIKSLELLQEIAETKYKSKFIVVVWPQIDLDPVFLIDNLKKTNLNLIFLPEYLKDYEYMIKNDWHPNAKANEEVAKILMEYINNKENKN